MKGAYLDETVGKAVQDFYHTNNFGEDGGVNEKYAWIKFGFISLPIPNSESRKRNVYLHDVNHIATGFDTTWKGESAVSAWEIASGGWQRSYFLWFLALWARGLGVLFYPTNVLKSFRQGLTMNNALNCGLSKSEIYNLSVSDFRQLLSNKPKRIKNPYLWMLGSLSTFLLPFAVGIILLFLIMVHLNFK